MSEFMKAEIKRNGTLVLVGHPVDKKTAMRMVKHGENVYGTRRNAETLASALSDGVAVMRDAPHNQGRQGLFYPHYHDMNHKYPGHIFYGNGVPGGA